MIPPSPPPGDQGDPQDEAEEAQEAEDTQQGNDGSIRFQVTLEEGDEESISGIWRRLVGLCRKLSEKVQFLWKIK